VNPVETFLSELHHPLKREILELRKIILSSNPQLTERIKWNAPSFCKNGDDRITFQLHGTGFFRVIFHCGAKKKDNTLQNRLFKDPTGLLEWAANDKAILKFTNLEQIQKEKDQVLQIVKLWLEHS